MQVCIVGVDGQVLLRSFIQPEASVRKLRHVGGVHPNVTASAPPIDEVRAAIQVQNTRSLSLSAARSVADLADISVRSS